jgi:hypothetical protein
MAVNEMISPIIGGTLVMMVWSFAYRENPFSRFTENLFVGLTIGYGSYIGFKVVIDNLLTPLLRGELINIVPLIFGILVITRISSEYAYLSRWALAAIAGAGSGVAVRGAIPTHISSQVIATIRPLFDMSNPVESFGNIVIVVGVITTLMYFFYTYEAKGSAGAIYNAGSRIGRIFLMVTCGAIVGSDLLSSESFLVDRAEFLLTTPYAWIPIPIAVAAIIFDIIRRRSQ